MSAQPPLPPSYTHLPLTTLTLAHHPATAPSPTPVIVLSLHRPGHHNAFTETMGDELERVFGLLDRDDRVRCVVVTGGSGKIFCAGADLGGARGRVLGERGAYRDGGGRVTMAIHACRKPVIAAINGSAVGIGITMTLPMAIRLAPRSAKIGFVFARRGLIMEAGSSYFLPRLIGLSRATHLVTTGATYPPTDPLLDGLFSEILATPAEVLPRALQLADEFVRNCSGVSWALMRDLMWRGPASAEEAHLLDSKLLYDVVTSRDYREGVKSFLEKREPRFEGSLGGEDRPEAWPWWKGVGGVEGGKKKKTGEPKL